MVVRLTFYGGVNEIGGNKILLQDQDTAIFLDFGMSFSERRKFYSEPWLSPRDEKGLLELGILPQLEGVYSFDHSSPSIEAVFLSHSHADHSLYISLLNRMIPVHCGEATAIILRSLAEIRPRSFETDMLGLELKTFRTGQKTKIGSLEIEPIHVDHSVPGSYGYIIYTSAGAIAYSGDFRVHGTKPQMTLDFARKMAEAKPEIAIFEATNLMGADVSTEREVKMKVDKVVSGTSKIVLADFSYVDVDRFRTFYEVARGSGRDLAISLKQAYLFTELKKIRGLDVPDIRTDENILIYQRMKKRYYNWEREILAYENVKEASEVRGLQEKLILVCSFYDLKELVELKPEPGSNFILSGSEPFNEEQEVEFDKFINWLDHFGLPMHHIHCSGHVMPNELKRIISEVKPKKVFPIHTDHPELFGRFVSNLVDVEIPKKEVSYEIK